MAKNTGHAKGEKFMANKPLEGKVAIVTGAGSPIGMGRAMSLALVGAGARGTLIDIN